MWDEYVAAHPGLPAEEPVVDHFGDSAGLADELLDLVLHGPKRATAALVVEFVESGEPLPRLGSHWVACDGDGGPRAILRSTELRLEVVFERFAVVWPPEHADGTEHADGGASGSTS
nr:hypothetical protein [Actinotalea sp. C106]